jgi:hypothetical protein
VAQAEVASVEETRGAEMWCLVVTCTAAMIGKLQVNRSSEGKEIEIN